MLAARELPFLVFQSFSLKISKVGGAPVAFSLVLLGLGPLPHCSLPPAPPQPRFHSITHSLLPFTSFPLLMIPSFCHPYIEIKSYFKVIFGFDSFHLMYFSPTVSTFLQSFMIFLIHLLVVM